MPPGDRQPLRNVVEGSYSAVPEYRRRELEEIWSVLLSVPGTSPRGMVAGAIRYLEQGFDEEFRDDYASLGPDIWRAVIDNIENVPPYYALYCAFRSGSAMGLKRLQQVPCLQTLAARLLDMLLATNPSVEAPRSCAPTPAEGAALGASGTDPYRDLFNAMLSDQSFNCEEREMYETGEDWLWRHLHQVLLAADAADFQSRLTTLQETVKTNLKTFDSGEKDAWVPGVKALLLTLQLELALKRIREVDPLLAAPAEDMKLVLDKQGVVGIVGLGSRDDKEMVTGNTGTCQSGLQATPHFGRTERRPSPPYQVWSPGPSVPSPAVGSGVFDDDELAPVEP